MGFSGCRLATPRRAGAAAGRRTQRKRAALEAELLDELEITE